MKNQMTHGHGKRLKKRARRAVRTTAYWNKLLQSVFELKEKSK